VVDAWAIVAIVGAASMALKASGPVLLGGKVFPPRLSGMIELLAPSVLAALVVVATFGAEERLQIDPRLAGVGAALVAIRLRAPVLLVVVLAATVTALVRLLT
jgi:branched chain amino acid efflux pump